MTLQQKSTQWDMATYATQCCRYTRKAKAMSMILAPSRMAVVLGPAVRVAVSLGPADMSPAVDEGPVEERVDRGTDGVLLWGLAEDDQDAAQPPEQAAVLWLQAGGRLGA